jgi:hypothetical protein
VVLGFELMALDLLGRPSTTWAILPVSSAFKYFSNKVSLLCPGWPRPWSSYLCFRHSWNDRYVSSWQAFNGWHGVSKTFCPSWLQTLIFLISTSWVARLWPLCPTCTGNSKRHTCQNYLHTWLAHSHSAIVASESWIANHAIRFFNEFSPPGNMGLLLCFHNPSKHLTCPTLYNFPSQANLRHIDGLTP